MIYAPFRFSTFVCIDEWTTCYFQPNFMLDSSSWKYKNDRYYFFLDTLHYTPNSIQKKALSKANNHYLQTLVGGISSKNFYLNSNDIKFTCIITPNLAYELWTLTKSRSWQQIYKADMQACFLIKT